MNLKVIFTVCVMCLEYKRDLQYAVRKIFGKRMLYNIII